MLKMFTAALLAASVLAAPAMANGIGQASRAQHPLDARAQAMPRHGHSVSHHRHMRPHVRFHNRFGLHKAHKHSAFKATVVHKHG